MNEINPFCGEEIEIEALLVSDEGVDKFMAAVGSTPETALENLLNVIVTEFLYVLRNNVEPFDGIQDTPSEFKEMYANANEKDVPVKPIKMELEPLVLCDVRLAA